MPRQYHQPLGSGTVVSHSALKAPLCIPHGSTSVNAKHMTAPMVRDSTNAERMPHVQLVEE